MAEPAADRSDVMAVANAGALVRDAAVRAGSADVMEIETPYGMAVVHVDGEGADVHLPSGSTVHVRWQNADHNR